MEQQQLEVLTVNPKISPQASVIWMHGLGADGHDFVDIVPQLNLPETMAVRFVFPHAPIRPVTINFGMEMRAWFDVYALAANAKQDETGIRHSQTLIEKLIAHELNSGIASEKIILAGFSQGAAMALHCGLRYSKKLAGILALSSFLPLTQTLADEINAANKKIPILMMHGEYDDLVPITWAKHSRDILQDLDFTVEWHSYPIQHGVCQEEIDMISGWLQNIFRI